LISEPTPDEDLLPVKWIKQGLIYAPKGKFDWDHSHAQLPIVDGSNKTKWKVYFATRDSTNRSNVTFIEVEAGKPENILYEHDRPILHFGALGTFDESGLMPVAIVDHGKTKYLYYAGWSRRKTVPYQNAIGLALSLDGGKTFAKYSEGPLLGICPQDPYFTGTANIMIENGCWKIWYQSCTSWQMIEGVPEPFYHLKYAESTDGISWKREGVVAIDYQNEAEGGICSASVSKKDGVYRMWYCYRQARDYRNRPRQSYRIGYADSIDGIKWVRKDHEAGIDVSKSGWDSEMIAYPFVLRHDDTLHLFYNGNGFGRTGFGHATSKIT
jgi:hypothetical protein